MARIKHPLSLAKWKYNKHKAQAKFRNIGFYFTFEDWYQWWLNNGVDKNVNVKWAGDARPCMCRLDDNGDYEINNVYFATNSQNARDSVTHIKLGLRPKPNGKPMMLTYRWGTETVDRDFLNSRGFTNQEAYNHFRHKVYEAARATEFKKLKIKFLKQHGPISHRRRWEGADGVYYKLVRDAIKSLGVTADTYRKRVKLGIYKKTMATPTFKDFILANSRYPDPLLPDTDEC